MVIDDENAVSFRLTGLREWTKYGVQLAAFNRVGRSNFTETVIARTRESGTLIIIIMRQFMRRRTMSIKTLQGHRIALSLE